MMEKDEVKNLEDLVEYITDWWHNNYERLEFTTRCFVRTDMKRLLANEVEDILDRIRPKEEEKQ